MPAPLRIVMLGNSVPDSDSHAASPARLRCQHCGEVIGVYEPLVTVGQGGWRVTSVAAEPNLDLAGAECFHAACHDRM